MPRAGVAGAVMRDVVFWSGDGGEYSGAAMGRSSRRLPSHPTGYVPRVDICERSQRDMNASDIHRVAVIGAGLMGHGIALEFAAHGYAVQLHDRDEAQLDQARAGIAE